MTTFVSPSPYPYPSGTPSSQPYSFTATPAPLNTPYVSYIAMPSYSSSPRPTYIIYDKQKILSDISDDAFYGIICAIIFVVLYSSIHAIYYYKKYKKEKLRLKRYNELQGKVHSNVRTVLNPAYPA